MFDKYVELSKEKSFFIPFVILIIILCVTYSYNFQYILMWDDAKQEAGFSNALQTAAWNHRLHYDPRAFGFMLATFISDGSTSKNALIFLNIIFSSWLAIFYIHQGFQVKNKFWTPLLATVISGNAAIGMHYNYFGTAALHMTPSFFALSLFVAVIVQLNLKRILISSLLLFLCVSVYQPILHSYIIAVIALVIVNLLKNRDMPLKDLFLQQLKFKIIPAITVLVLAVLIDIAMMSILLKSHNNLIFNAVKTSHAFLNFWHHLSVLFDKIIFQMYVGTLHNDRLVFLAIFITAFISVILLLKKQPVVKKVIILATISLLIFMMPIIINFMELYQGTHWQIVRLCVPYGTMLSLLLYLIYQALGKIKFTKGIVSVLSFILVLQIINATITRAYRLVQGHNARMATFNRLLLDVSQFARANNVKGKPVIYLFYTGISGNHIYGGDRFVGKHKYLYEGDYMELAFLYHHWFTQAIYALGAVSDFSVYGNAGKIKSVCHNIIDNMQRWPFTNSMKLVDGVIYVKMEDKSKSALCDNPYNIYYVGGAILKKDGYVLINESKVPK